MFKDPFSFEGRIRRTEYGLSYLIATVSLLVVAAIAGALDAMALYYLFLIPFLWFIWSQGARRCHDLGNSGFWQLIPFYGLWLLFAEGEPGTNKYGDNPKGISSGNQFTSTTPGAGYQGGYNGGHNNPSSGNPTDQNQSNSGEYQSGDLYR